MWLCLKVWFDVPLQQKKQPENKNVSKPKRRGGREGEKVLQ